MDDDQIGALRDFVSAAWHYLTAPKADAPARRAELCEAVGALLYALEGPLPDDDHDPDDDPGDNVGDAPAEQPETMPRVRVERFVEDARTGGRLLPGPQGGTVIPLFGRRRKARRTKREDR